MEYHRGSDPYFSQFNVILMSIAVIVPALMWFMRGPKGRRAYIAPGQWPILGHAAYFNEKEILQFNEKMILKARFQSGEPDFECFVLGKRYLFISNWEVVSELLRQRPVKFRRDRSFESWANEFRLNNGLFNAEDPEWGRIRRLTAPSFATPSVKAIAPEIFSQTNVLITDLKSRIVAASSTGGIIDGLVPCKQFTTSVIFAMAFGSTVHSFEYVSSGQLLKDLDLLLLWMFRRSVNPFPMWIHNLLNAEVEGAFLPMKARMQALIELVLEREQNVTDEEGAKNTIFLHMLRTASLKEVGGRSSLNHDELVAQVYTTLIAGSETTSVTMECALWVLGQDQYSKLQAELQAEVDQLLTGPGTSCILQDVEQVDALPLLNAMVMETLRLYGPGRILFLQTANYRDVQLPCDYVLSPNVSKIRIN